MTRTFAGSRERYVAELTEALVALGVPASRAEEVGREVASHLADSGASPVDEFGTPAEFAAHIAQKPGPEGDPSPPRDQRPDAGSARETMSFNADAFTEMEILAVVGRDGWEVVDVDQAGRFRCTRDPAALRRWVYTRRLALTPRRLAELHQDGWQDCGRWGCSTTSSERRRRWTCVTKTRTSGPPGGPRVRATSVCRWRSGSSPCSWRCWR